MQVTKFMVAVFIFTMTDVALAQNPPPAKENKPLGAVDEISIYTEGPEDDPFLIPESVKKYRDEKKMAAMRSKACSKYNKKYISYYDDVYYVEKCKRKAVEGAQAQYELTKRRQKIEPVEAEVIAVIPQGEALADPKNKKMRNCKQLNHKYVSFSDVDVYWVDKCQLHIFIDWESYIQHRNRGTKGEILALTWDEFYQFFKFDKQGELEPFPEMKSVVDEEYAKMSPFEPEVDIIPVDEACAGLNGKWVSFYSKMYKIEKCRKREVDPEKYWLKNSRVKGRPKILELKAEQWISLPDGKPIEI